MSLLLSLHNNRSGISIISFTKFLLLEGVRGKLGLAAILHLTAIVRGLQ